MIIKYNEQISNNVHLQFTFIKKQFIVQFCYFTLCTFPLMHAVVTANQVAAVPGTGERGETEREQITANKQDQSSKLSEERQKK